MNPKELQLKLKKAFYPALTVLFFLVLVFLFTRTMLFFSKSVSKAFPTSETSTLDASLQFDAETYQFVQERLKLPAPKNTTIPAPTTGPSTKPKVAPSL